MNDVPLFVIQLEPVGKVSWIELRRLGGDAVLSTYDIGSILLIQSPAG